MRSCSPVLAVAKTSDGVPRTVRTSVLVASLVLTQYRKSDRSMVRARSGTPRGELTAGALFGRGARVTLPIAAALGSVEDARRLLPLASGAERHRALAMASQIGCIEIVRLLLDAGEDPNRYNPLGGHSHTTPLHQAALVGNDELVRLLIQRGARADTRDLMWNGTPADWARHEGRTEMEEFLRGIEGNQAG